MLATAIMLACSPALADGPPAICAAVEVVLDRLAQPISGSETGNRGISPMSGAETCDQSLTLEGGRAFHCAWRFAYREAEAGEAFRTMADKLSRCTTLTTRAEAGTGPRVNHPDSYDLIEFNTPRGLIALSLKDKGALQRSYVFLRIAAAPPG